MDKIVLGHGSGGLMTNELVKTVFLKYFSNPSLNTLEDAAELESSSVRLAFTTDSYVVSPVEFPGGDIGKLAVCGTVNDLAVKGAIPKWISAAFILEEGLDIALLERVCASMKSAAEEAGVFIVTGDTKVVEKGKADKIFITTAGVGEIPAGVSLSPLNIKEGDAIIINGAPGAHGVTVMNERHNLGIKGGLKSDCAPLNKLSGALISVCGVHAMRDLTRGGLAAALCELAQSCGLDFEIDETLIPADSAVSGACAILGLDPLYVANEGKLVAFVPGADTAKALNAMRAGKYGAASAVIGRVAGPGGKVALKTRSGGLRLLRLPEGEQLPRIC